MRALILSLLLIPSVARANPYFRPLDISHPKFVLGALLAPENLKNSAASSMTPLITHSPKDGCILPSFVCEDWTPLAIGGSMNAGKITFDVAPLFNVLPWMQSGARAITPSKWTGLVDALTPVQDPEAAPVTFSAGPAWEYQQATNKGFFRVFAGLALHF